MLRRPDAGVLSVAATPQTIDGVLSGFLARYAKERPNVHVTLIEAVGAELMAVLHRGEAHLLITTAGAIETSDQPVDTIWLPSLEFIAASSPDAKLAQSSRMDIRGLGSHPLLLPNKSFAVRQAFDAACRIAEFKPNVRFESRTPHTLLALAEAGLGVAVVPSVLPTHRYKLQVVGLTYRNKPLREGYGLVFDRAALSPARCGRVCPCAGDLCERGIPDLAAVCTSVGQKQTRGDQSICKVDTHSLSANLIYRWRRRLLGPLTDARTAIQNVCFLKQTPCLMSTRPSALSRVTFRTGIAGRNDCERPARGGRQ